MTATHWKIPKPEWDSKGLLWHSGRYLGAVFPKNEGFLAAVPIDGLRCNNKDFWEEEEARAWVEEQAMKALGAEEVE